MQRSVFLSSTFEDLVEHRARVLHVLHQMKLMIQAMEYFGAESDAPLHVCLEAVNASDIYIGVIGMRYGHTDEDGISFTEREYQRAYAQRETKQIHIYLLDEERHPVAPARIERGVGFERLQKFKTELRRRHGCIKFDSVSDLAMKVAVDLVNDLKPTQAATAKVEQFIAKLPDLRLSTGYGIGLRPMTRTARAMQDEGADHATFEDPLVAQAASAAVVAAAIARSDYTILDGLLTFDKQDMDLLIALLRVWGIDPQALSLAIRATNDPMKFRLLAAIAGRLAIDATAEAICDAMLNRYAMQRQFKQLGQIATPVRDTVRFALKAFGSKAHPTIERYALRARELGRWQQKQLFEAVLKAHPTAPLNTNLEMPDN